MTLNEKLENILMTLRDAFKYFRIESLIDLSIQEDIKEKTQKFNHKDLNKYLYSLYNELRIFRYLFLRDLKYNADFLNSPLQVMQSYLEHYSNIFQLLAPIVKKFNIKVRKK